MNPEINLFHKYFPEEAVSYCHQLWQTHRFHFKITRQRKTKIGDYRYDPRKKMHFITVNHNLNPYAFCLTFVHEVAHLVTYIDHSHKVAPHGKEWKAQFRKLLQPLLLNHTFPPDVLQILIRHMKNPKATCYSDADLTRILRKYDPQKNGEMQVYLEDILNGNQFVFQKRLFQKQYLRRTRVLCKEIGSGKKYLISKMAMVDIVPESID